MNGVLTIPLSGQVLDEVAPGSTGLRPAPAVRPWLAGRENELVYVAVEACLEQGGRRKAEGGNDDNAARRAAPFSPLVLCGPPGSGKSHLALGIAGGWQRCRPDDRVVVATAADFSRDLHDPFDSASASAERARYRAADLFVFEDLSALARKPAAQNELRNLLDEWEATGAQVIVTSRMALEAIDSLPPDLVGRLESGLVLSLNLPGNEVRRELLARLAAERKTPIEPAALTRLADALPVSAPELVGALLHLEAAAAVDGRTIGMPQVQQYASRRTRARMPSLRAIAAQTARHFRLKVSDLRSPSRRRNLVLARDVAMCLARRLTDKSLIDVGRHFGGRDHTTVLHGCRKTEELMQSDPEIRRTIHHLQQTLENRV